MQAYDLEYIFLVPDIFDISNPSSIHQATKWTNVLDDWAGVSLVRCKEWHEFLLSYGGRVDVETDRWAAGVLNKSVDADLKSELSSALEEHPMKHRGAVVMFRLIAKRIFERNQEAKVAMMEYLTKFDLRNTNGQHVPTAALRIRAVCRALGPDVPPRVVRCVLDGMKHASNVSFKCICETNSALLSNSLY